MGLFATPSEGEFLRPFCKHAPCPSCATYSAASSAGWRKPQRAPSQDVVGGEGGLGLGAPHPKGVGLVHGSTLGAVQGLVSVMQPGLRDPSVGFGSALSGSGGVAEPAPAPQAWCWVLAVGAAPSLRVLVWYWTAQEVAGGTPSSVVGELWSQAGVVKCFLVLY